ncbi:DUF5320 domain-containing protein [Phosphitispora sp. TUW77]|uniref:DUF5320 domain-containing protein n=1 Tax=Phosphitispora sp. TUW77 TaxID=3152361 RepID=UPI003AB41615
MPGFDGAGPSGQGAMTGKGRGYCMAVVSPENTFSGTGQGAGNGGKPRGCGFGRCFGKSRNARSGRKFQSRKGQGA